MKFVVDRSKWRNGGTGEDFNISNKYGDTALLNQEGYRCCLGFVCNQLGVEDGMLEDIGQPDDIDLNDINNIDLSTLVRIYDGAYELSELSERAITINDNGTLSVENRELKLIELFKEFGHELVFEGEYEKDYLELLEKNYATRLK